MTTTFSDSIAAPRFRADVATRIGAGSAWIEYKGSSWSLSFPPEARSEIVELLARLKDRTSDEQTRSSPEALPSGYEELVRELDRMGVLEERPPTEEVRLLTGKSACLELRAFIETAKRHCCRSRLFLAMEAGAITRRQLLAYVKQYYFIVHAFPQILGGALARAPAEAMDTLRRFFLAEAFHDSLLTEAMAAIGEKADQELPLPATLGLIASLSTYARHDLPSFFAGLWIFETPTPLFMSAFARTVSRLELPKEFAEPLIRHGDINASEAHDTIPDELMGALAMVSEPALGNTKKNIVCMLEQFDRLEGSLLEIQ